MHIWPETALSVHNLLRPSYVTRSLLIQLIIFCDMAISNGKSQHPLVQRPSFPTDLSTDFPTASQHAAAHPGTTAVKACVC